MIALKQYQKYPLKYQVTTGYRRDERGNSVPVTAERTLEIVFKATDAERTAYGAGADENQLLVEGACWKPKLMPPEIVGGQVFEFPYNGRTAKLAIRPLPRRPLAKLDLKLGQGFEGTLSY